ncbi:formate dehydrogenase accessory sulfurtransferase FdhD [Halobacillus salinus]|uniref:Sulfur carrier protein FdhD n=1 Tax=Halobacillus salinus TaxID=192814 RepID=A0A4Z0H401_9BACI|nr:formate dehydrogenase accessory sulfurtransferase FdhD [Halobacillus salinus]TGB05143.1 formate dehydrogenase accessory sulfurtransferase FdhD [Halobacillus salinus]
MKQGTSLWNVSRVECGEVTELQDEVAVEFPLTLVVNGKEFATMVCSPLDLEVLVIGFLASEGIIRRKEDISSLSIDEDTGFAYIELTKEVPVVSTMEKRWIGSCCGKSRAFYFQSDAKTARTIMNHFQLEPEVCLQLMKQFHAEAQVFKKTGGVHQASIATREGLEVTFADIGRHNALDKLLGHMILHQLRNKEHTVLFSGRISSEVLLKISKMGIGFLLSKSAPTDLALKLAEDLNITAIGFVRDDRMNVYTHPERLKTDVAPSFAEMNKGGIDVD